MRWFCVRQTLPEGHNIWELFALLKCINKHFGVLHILEPLLLKPGVQLGDPQKLSADRDSLAIDRHGRPSLLCSEIDP